MGARDGLVAVLLALGLPGDAPVMEVHSLLRLHRPAIHTSIELCES